MYRKNLQMPPEGMLFYQLFNHIVVQGIGNETGRNAERIPWSDVGIASAFEERGDSLDVGTFKKWKSGSALIKPKKMHVLAAVAGGGVRKYVEPWSEALGRARSAQEEARKDAIRIEQYQPLAKKLGGIPNAEDMSPRPSSIGLGEQIVRARNLLAGAKSGFASGSVVPPTPEGANYNLLSPSDGPYISNLKVCSEENFRSGQNACSCSEASFPLGTKKVFLSFIFHNMPTGTPFQRRWYRNGEKFREKMDFYDAAWPEYTFLWNESGHDPGHYVVRIITGERSATIEFTIG